MVAAVSELEPTYQDRVDFVIVPAEETNARQDEIAAFGFADQMHGLVVFGPDGEPAAKLPGHNFGAEEIEAALAAALTP